MSYIHGRLRKTLHINSTSLKVSGKSMAVYFEEVAMLSLGPWPLGKVPT